MASEILKIHQDLLNNKISCTELIKKKIAELEKNDLNSANFLLSDMALEIAEKVDKKISQGEEVGILEGIPFGLKDVYLLQGCPASASSDFLKNYKSPYTATAIQKLLDAGAIPIVKENCDCFGHGSSSENTVFGPVKNAVNEKLVAGGSSGGSAANVARGYTVFSIGEDTGGSIRQPAGFNKVYGLKPTYGRISRYGVMAYASSTDCVGPISRSLEDIRLLLNIMSGRDGHDQTTFDSTPVPEDVFTEEFIPGRIKAGYYKDFLKSDALEPEIKKDFMKVIDSIRGKGIKVRELDFYDTSLLVSTYYTIAMAETASNLARLDGINYGRRQEASNLKEGYSITRSENFTEETKRRIVGGNQVLAQGHAEEIYLKARMLRNKIAHSFHDEFKEADIIISPVSPNTPPAIGTSLSDPLTMYLSDAYTVGFSLGGLPTLTYPAGTDTGIQITANKCREDIILKFANYLNKII
jgi:aspartyl-tRNA(Asn)/glutamyl-tRNA(Gln) amidotransferase subunit A